MWFLALYPRAQKLSTSLFSQRLPVSKDLSRIPANLVYIWLASPGSFAHVLYRNVLILAFCPEVQIQDKVQVISYKRLSIIPKSVNNQSRFLISTCKVVYECFSKFSCFWLFIQILKSDLTVQFLSSCLTIMSPGHRRNLSLSLTFEYEAVCAL